MLPIYFYAPDKITQKNIEQNQDQWTGHHSNFTAWIAQTYFHLKKTGFPCQIATEIPEKGILIADRDTLANNYPFLDKVMLICIQSDKEYHPSAHLHVVYNPLTWEKTKNSIWNPYLINHWPMPGLIPRDKKRQTLVENISYIGTKSQLAPELKSEKWQQKLLSLNLKWQPVWESESLDWNNYKYLDIIIAARSFDSNKYPNKGSIKLINAWHAGVPAILTPELGFLAERKTELDFIIVRSLSETIDAIHKLQNSPELYEKMVKNGLERAQEFTIEKITNQWITFLTEVALPSYENWYNLKTIQKQFLFYRKFSLFKYERAKHKVNQVFAK